jgi:putative membrane protein
MGNKPSVRATDYLANERTFLAWTRTGVALIALGFVVARFGLLLRELATRSGVPPSTGIADGHVSSYFGTAIVLLAALLLALSYVRYRATARALDRGEYGENRLLTAALAATVILIAVALAIYLLFTAG